MDYPGEYLCILTPKLGKTVSLDYIYLLPTCRPCPNVSNRFR